MTSHPEREWKRPRRPRFARQAYLIMALVFLAAIIIQVFLAGAGIFSAGVYLAHHVDFVEWFQPLPLFLLLAAFLGHMGRFAKIAPVAAFIALGLQYEFVNVRPHIAAGLHTINALFLFWLASEMVRRAWRTGS